MAANRYMQGAAVLAAQHQQRRAREIVGGFNWGMLAQAFGVPTGSSINPMDILYTGGPGAGRGAAGSGSNSYWGAQRTAAKQTPWASAGVSRQQAGLQLQQVLRQQQQANLASLQAQLAQMGQSTTNVPLYTPSPIAQQQPTQPAFTMPDSSSGDPSSATTDSGGDTVVGDDAEPSLVIRVKNMADVIRSQSSLGGLALYTTPALIKNIAYGKMRDEFKANLAQKGVDADVSLATNPPTGKSSGSSIWLGAAIGAGAVGVGALLWRFIRGGR